MLSIRASRYRGQRGWLLCGQWQGKRIRVFVATREAAARCKARLLAGEEITLDDMEARKSEQQQAK